MQIYGNLNIIYSVKQVKDGINTARFSVREFE